MEAEKSFNSKVLLFGEYSIIKDSSALAIPFPLFDGKLHFQHSNQQCADKEVNRDTELQAFCKYLQDLNGQMSSITFDTTSFAFDIDQGLIFDSTIPQGFGVGSSAALCAAAYERYAVHKTGDFLPLKHIFTLMESHFHGKSSGIDPLISYLNAPILIKGQEDISIVDLPKHGTYVEPGMGAIFLLNSGRPRRTEPLVNLFLEKCNQDNFNKLCSSELKEVTNNCIEAFLCADHRTLYADFAALSNFQYRHFTPMIPKLYRKLWKQGLDSSDFYLKLCGAGGGGFFLGITKDLNKVKSMLPDLSIRVIYAALPQ